MDVFFVLLNRLAFRSPSRAPVISTGVHPARGFMREYFIGPVGNQLAGRVAPLPPSGMATSRRHDLKALVLLDVLVTPVPLVLLVTSVTRERLGDSGREKEGRGSSFL